MNLSLQQKTALVCGSTQGIGLAIAQELALIGANCILMARNSSSLQAAVETLDTSFHQLHRFIVADVSDTASLKKAIHEVLQFAPVHILVNNTGGPAAGPITEAAPEDFEAAFRQHVSANQLLVQALLPGMKSEGYGRIINIISTSVKLPLPNLGVSNTIRGAVASWAKTLSNEVAPFGITVNNILPGLTETGRLQSLIRTTAAAQQKEEAQVRAEMQQSVPVKRFGTPQEIAAMAAFLATPAAAYVNGTSIRVDGGRTGSI